MAQTIRDIVKSIQRECLASTELTPDHAAELLVMLTAILSNISDEQRAADLAYAQLHLELLQVHGTASRARLYAEVTPEYARRREAKDCGVLATELIRSLKMFLRTKSEERQWSGHQ